MAAAITELGISVRSIGVASSGHVILDTLPGARRRHHLDESAMQKAMRGAVRAAGRAVTHCAILRDAPLGDGR
jgi:hypothetical protein